MTATYRDRGYLSAKVSLASAVIDLEQRTVVVRFSVEEGPQAIIRDVKLVGMPEGVALEKGLAVAAGQPLSGSALERERNRLISTLGRRGYLFAQVVWGEAVSPDGTQADLLARVEAGPQVRVGKILPTGNNRTRESVVLGNLEFAEGDVIDPEALFESQRNLVLLGIFRSVTVRLSKPEEVEPSKDVIIELRENPRFFGEVSGGYFVAEGPRVGADFNYPNIGGLAINLAGHFKVNYVGLSGPVLSGQTDASDLRGIDLFGGRFNVGAHNRGLLPSDIGSRLDLIAEQVYKPSGSRFRRVALVPGLDWSTLFNVPVEWARLKLTLALQYEIETGLVTISDKDRVLFSELSALERKRYPEGPFGLHSLRFGPTLDLRDDPANPQRGVLLALSAERTWDLARAGRTPDGAVQPIETLKLAGSLTGYIPLAQRWVLALSARGGRIVLLDPNASSTPPKRFYMGGSPSMRGFPEEGMIPADRRATIASEVTACRELANTLGCTEVAKALLSGRSDIPSEGGDLFILGKAELRFPVLGDVDLGVFFEAGNLWLNPDGFNALALRYVAGAGIRYVTPVGPLALDLGVNLDPDPFVNESRVNVHFNIGLF
jgi:outer membrane protein assembly factor BamA